VQRFGQQNAGGGDLELAPNENDNNFANMTAFIETLRAIHASDANGLASRTHTERQREQNAITLSNLNVLFAPSQQQLQQKQQQSTITSLPLLHRCSNDINQVLSALRNSPQLEQQPSRLPLDASFSRQHQHNAESRNTDIDYTTRDPQLTDEQNYALLLTLKWLWQDIQNRLDPVHNTAKSGFLLMILGAPGSGKSFFANVLIQRAGAGHVICASPTGIAASMLPNGQTLHSLLGIPVKAGKRSVQQVGAQKLMEIRQQIGNAHLLLVDEVSMLDVKLFENVERRLQQVLDNHLPFGGIGLLFIGDFFQLPPIGLSLWKAAVDIILDNI